jgi:hypothetical protein
MSLQPEQFNEHNIPQPGEQLGVFKDAHNQYSKILEELRRKGTGVSSEEKDNKVEGTLSLEEARQEAIDLLENTFEMKEDKTRKGVWTTTLNNERAKKLVDEDLRPLFGGESGAIKVTGHLRGGGTGKWIFIDLEKATRHYYLVRLNKKFSA